MKHTRVYFFKILVIVLGFCSSLSAQALTPITLQLAWKYQFQFAGYIMAKEKGFYEKAGLDVTLKEYELKMEVNREVLEGRAHFGIGRSEIILDRLNEHMPFVQLLALCQASPVILQTLKRNDIQKIQDLKDKRFVLTGDGLSRDVAEVISMLYSVGIFEHEILKTKGSTYGPEDLINGNGDVITAYSTISPFHLQKLGYESTIFYPKDYGFDFYSDILFSMESYIQSHPEDVSHFYEASLKGWNYAFNHIDETIDVILTKYNSQNLSKELLYYEAEAFRKLAFFPNVPFGDINPIKIEKIVNSFRFLNLTKNPNNEFNTFIYHHPLQEVVKLPFHWSLFKTIIAVIVALIFLLIINQVLLFKRHRKLKYEDKKLKEKHSHLEEISRKDALTKLYNRHYLMESAQHLIELSQRTHQPLSYMMLDIDNFKMINDTYGHGIGDEALKVIAKTIKNSIRKSDIAARFGGEEFIVLLPNTSLEAAQTLAEKIRFAVEYGRIPINEHYLMMTVSIGVSQLPHEREISLENFWHQADEALYEAKQSGKNRVVTK